jgi:hypothetical protein
MLKQFVTIVVVGLPCLIVAQPSALGDSGDVRLSSIVGAYRVSVFTSPTPLAAGPVDVSVLVQDAKTNELVDDAQVSIRVQPVERVDESIEVLASRAAATNKLLQSAAFELPSAGAWRIETSIDGAAGSAQATCEVVVGERLGEWNSMWLWIAYPLVPVAFYTIGEIRRQRRGARRPSEDRRLKVR